MSIELIVGLSIAAIILSAVAQALVGCWTSDSIRAGHKADEDCTIPIVKSEHPSLADQFDTRLTNIFKNPKEDIL